MTITEYVAQQTMRMAEALAYFIETTQAERLDWQPVGEDEAETRSALDQVSECIEVNHAMAALLRGETVRPPSGLELADGGDAQRRLLASAEDLAAAIRGVSEADLDRTYSHPRGQILGRNMILMGYRNMAYHAGQINFIQTLYGDPEFHVPPNWR